METRPQPTTRTISKTPSIPRLRWLSALSSRCDEFDSGLACPKSEEEQTRVRGPIDAVDPSATSTGSKSRSAISPPPVLSFRSEALEHRAVKRREFVTLLGGSAIALAFSPAASAQGRQARIGLLMPVSPPAAYLAAFREGLRERG